MERFGLYGILTYLFHMDIIIALLADQLQVPRFKAFLLYLNISYCNF